ncbi:MAG: sulfatase [Candidatus Sabulitectum sp.]|nr:sulfatase [Candidatus Sabulitectum sp.]
MPIKLIPLFTILAVIAGCTSTPPDTSGCRIPSNGKNVILIIIDTLRSDHLSCFGYQRNTSPTIDSLADSGTLWLNAQSQAPWTLPSHASIWTGLSVKSHGTTHIGGVEGFDLQLDPQLPSLPATLQNSGFQTSGFINFVLLSEEFGFNHGFDWYDCDGSGERTVTATVDAFLYWLDYQAETENFFCVIHLFDVHAPYNPMVPYDTAFCSEGVDGVSRWDLSENGKILNIEDCQHLIDMYDGEILYVDNELSRLFSGIRQREIADSTLIIITSDHGEEFLEHGGVGHGHALYQEQIHVPLILSGPGINRGSISNIPAALYDIMPTILSYLGVEVPENVEGLDLLSHAPAQLRQIPSGGVSPDRFFLAMMSLSDFQSCAVTEGSKKVIAYMGTDRFIQFNLDEDPEENIPLAADSTMIEKALFYWATPRRGNPSPIGELTDEINSTLRDLGYIR